MKRSFKTISKLLVVTGCVSVLAYNIANAAPLVYDVDESTPEVRTNYTTPNKIKLEGDVEFNDHGQKISLSLRDTDVQQVLRMFADKAGLNIVFHDSAKGNVTLDLVDVSLEDAFKMVMKMCGLTYVIKDKTLLIVSSVNSFPYSKFQATSLKHPLQWWLQPLTNNDTLTPVPFAISTLFISAYFIYYKFLLLV